MRKSRGIRALSAPLLTMLVACFSLLSMSNPAQAQSDPEPVDIHIRWISTLPEDGILMPSFLFGFHNGQFDVFELDRPPTPVLAAIMASMRGEESAALLMSELSSEFAPAAFGRMTSDPLQHGPQIGTPPPGWPRYQELTIRLRPNDHRFLSYVGAVQPSDDAFVGNHDPHQIELFDADGRFKGPQYIDLFGGQVLDAGVCANTESDLPWLDWSFSSGASDCLDGEGIVRPHPGLNGSQRNPEGAPQHVLGGEHAPAHGPPLVFGPVTADFSRPGYKLGRLVITRSHPAARYAVTGSWYNPERDGEGFNIELVEPDPAGGPARMLLYWYTYEPDDSGRQIWLGGLADVVPQQGGVIRFDLIRSEGGRFASTDNPDLVERSAWGHLDLSFASCNQGTVRFEPLDPEWPAGEYDIFRLSPAIEGLGWICRDEDAQLHVDLPADDD